MLTKMYVTLGFAHKHELLGHHLDHNTLIIIYASCKHVIENAVTIIFGLNYSAIYPSETWKAQDNMYFKEFVSFYIDDSDPVRGPLLKVLECPIDYSIPETQTRLGYIEI